MPGMRHRGCPVGRQRRVADNTTMHLCDCKGLRVLFPTGKPRFTLATITRGGSKLPGTLSRTAPSGSLAGDLSAGQLHSAAATLLA